MSWIQIEGNPSVQEERNPRDSRDWFGFGLIAIAVAGILAMVATWLLVAYFPVPDDNAVYIGLLGFLSVMFFDLFILCGVAVSKLRQGQILAALTGAIGLFLLGLVAASAVGSLPLLWRWLTINMPWVQEIPWGPVLMLWLAANNLWMRQRTAQDRPRETRGKLIVQVSLSSVVALLSLLIAITKFSGGKAWLGALHLVVALLFGLLAATSFVEIWKRRRAVPSP